MVKLHPKKAGFVMNGVNTTSPMLFITNEKYFKRFAQIEIEVSIKKGVGNLSRKGANFFTLNGPEIIKMRRIFSEAFRIENLGLFAPEITTLIQKNHSELAISQEDPKKSFEVDLREFLKVPI